MILLELKGCKGDCQIEGYKEWILCTSLSFEVTREFSESGKGGTADLNLGQADLPPIQLGKSQDASSVYLFQDSISGVSRGQAKIAFVEAIAGDKTQEYLRYTLDNAVVATWSTSGDEDERPTEDVTLWYNKIQMVYHATTDGKTFVGHGPKGWDRIHNKTWDSPAK